MTHDLIVIGLGAVGSALVWQAARRGARVLGLDRHRPPHAHGSHHGHTRITRVAVGEGAEYVPFARRSHEIWRELEASTGQRLMQTTGALVLGRRGSASASVHGQADFVAATLAVARAHGIVHEELSAAEIRHRFPAFTPQDDESGCFEPGAGMLFPERCIATQLALAQAAGADLRFGEAVRSIAADGAGDGPGVRVHTAAGTHRAAQAVLCAGAWTPALAGGGFAQQLSVRRQTLHWFAPAQPALYAADRCPVFIWLHGADEADAFYGLPISSHDNDGPAAVKLGTAQYATTTTPDALQREVTAAESHEVFQRHAAGRLNGLVNGLVNGLAPGLAPQVVHTAACLYTVQAQARFVVAPHPTVPGLRVVSACSGHGFKHSAALGEALAEQALTGRSALDLGAFADLA